ncbi:MAG: DUF4360 domain-containing protein [Bdellovibrionaceae bacterium]|nr:DUF4360 domain-containing protein [Pseudobdellovibrionaceae bacterium]
MNIFKSMVVVSAIVMGSLAAQAQISLGQPAYGGTGCPAGSASATLTSDGSVLSVLFDQFAAEAGNTTGRRIDRKNCSLRIPVNVANGYQVALLAFDYRGFAAVPNGGTAILDASYAYIGQPFPVRFSKTFRGGFNSNYTVTNELISTTLTWSPCGKQVMLEASVSARTIAPSSMQQTMLAVDSVDVQAGILYSVHFQRCN